jgi:hypothetical protein
MQGWNHPLTTAVTIYFFKNKKQSTPFGHIHTFIFPQMTLVDIESKDLV